MTLAACSVARSCCPEVLSMFTLALETSTDAGSVALLKDQSVLSLREWRREKSHSELVTATIQECLTEASISAKQLNRIAVGHGPGSFTGIRIAINAAKTLSYSSGCSIFATNTFRTLAEPARLQKLPVLGLINAHKNLIYVAAIDLSSGKYSIEPDALSVEEIEQKVRSPHLCLGNGYDLWKDTFSEDLRATLVRDPIYSDEPSAAHLGRISVTASQDELISWQQLQPLYIRASEPEEKLKAGLFTDRSRINE
jgi:tRNA threonylcarbamoyladenosine biosynthesis protein TsaB